MSNPTKTTYDGLDAAYDFFNARLFAGALPRCLITMQRKAKAYGYFAGGRFGAAAAKKKKAASKTRYTCPDCQANAWAKPEVHLICGECEQRMVADEPAEGKSESIDPDG